MSTAASSTRTGKHRVKPPAVGARIKRDKKRLFLALVVW